MFVNIRPVRYTEVDRMNRVAILTYEGAALFELGCAVELFGLPRPEFENWYECEVVSFAPGPFTCTGGLLISGRHVEDLDNFDLLVVPSWPTSDQPVPDKIRTEVQRFFNRGKRVISFCSGAFLLAELGFFNERKAITHWRYADEFQQRFPEIEYIDEVLYLFNGQLGCSAGSSAAIDLGIEVIRQDYGYEIANKVARRMVLSAHRKGGQSQYAETPVQTPVSQFANALDWAVKNLNTAIDINQFAAQAKMSRRTFDRKFKLNLSITPKEWLTHQRLLLAKSLLEQHEFSIEKIAEMSGFDNAATMRHHFRKEFGMTPSSHREQFNAVDQAVY